MLTSTRRERRRRSNTQHLPNTLRKQIRQTGRSWVNDPIVLTTH